MKKERLLTCGHRINEEQRSKIKKLAKVWGMTLAEAHRRIIEQS